jgi:hypothetical protein
MKKIFLLVFVLALSFSSCEKDDICDANTPTTPRLIIDFYDITNPSVTKNVTNLGIVGEGLTTGILFNAVHKIQVPLRLTDDSTKYSFVLNAGNANTSLIYTDILQFNYSRKTVFVSRACGYKTLFDLNNDASLPNPYIINNTPTASKGIWIKNITVEKYNLETENETHIKIYF